MADTLRADRRALHGMPELGMELPRTTAYVEQRLRQMGLEPTRLGGGLTVCIGPRKGPVFLLTRKPQAMLVDEKSTSVETVKKEPPFATIEAGNANRTKAKGGSSIWTKKVYHIRVGIANITLCWCQSIAER